jgi:hypothetical protein
LGRLGANVNLAPAGFARVREDRGLSADEKAELDHCIELEHILRMAKAKARLILARAEEIALVAQRCTWYPASRPEAPE